MATTEILALASSGGANVMSQADYAALSDIANGYPSGILTSEKLNKTLRQATFMAAGLAQAAADLTTTNVVDDGNLATLVALIKAAITNGGSRPGQVLMGAWASPPSGTVAADATTIGNAGSGATGRANADTKALFFALWYMSATACPIFTSGGAGSTRTTGDPNADWTALKRIATPDLRDHVPRAYKSGGLGPLLMELQDDAMQRITGTVGTVLPTTSNGTTFSSDGAFSTSTSRSVYSGAGAQADDVVFNSANSTSPNAAKTNDVETRVKSFGVLICLSL